jgi:glycosyltransferase involved in cell wall biosynthesis
LVKVAAVSTVWNEADIIGATLTHLYTEGVANVYIADGMSSDGTRDVLAGFPCKVFDDTEDCHRQPYWISRLAQQAYDDGADWVIAWDADEFWYSPSGLTIAESLASLPESIGKLYAQMFQHVDVDYREPDPKPLPKVAIRATERPVIANGNHEASVPGGSLRGVLAIREIQYRTFEHFVRKIEERTTRLDPSLPAGEGTHVTQYYGWSKEQLVPVWEAMVGRATVLDPIPLRT